MNGRPNFPRKKVRFSIGNIDLFAYSLFQTVSFSPVLCAYGKVLFCFLGLPSGQIRSFARCHVLPFLFFSFCARFFSVCSLSGSSFRARSLAFRSFAFTLVRFRFALARFLCVRFHARSFLFRSFCARSLFACLLVFRRCSRFSFEPPPLFCAPFLVLLDVHLYVCLFVFSAR